MKLPSDSKAVLCTQANAALLSSGCRQWPDVKEKVYCKENAQKCTFCQDTI